MNARTDRARARELARNVARARRWAQRHKVPPATDLTQRERELLSLIESDVEANRALQFFVRKGYRQNLLLIHLTLSAFTPITVRDSQTEQWRRIDFEEGDHDRIDSAAQEMGRAATLVERLNDNKQGKPEAWRLWLGTRSLREQSKLAEAFHQLPHHLRSLVKALECRAAWVRMVKERMSLYEGRTYSTLAFLHTVHGTCKRNYFEKVASLLRVARKMAGDREKVSGASLTKLWKRHGGTSALSKFLADRQRVDVVAYRKFYQQYLSSPPR